MSFFEQFKGMMQRTFGGMRSGGKQQDTRRQLLDALDRADSWETLEEEFVALRERNRQHHRELLHRMDPLGEKVRTLLEEARKPSQFKHKREGYLREANNYLKELEALNSPCITYMKNADFLTELISQIHTARARDEQGVDAEVVDSLSASLEEVAERYTEVQEAVADLVKASPPVETSAITAAEVEARFQGLFDASLETAAESPKQESDTQGLDDLERRLYGEKDTE